MNTPGMVKKFFFTLLFVVHTMWSFADIWPDTVIISTLSQNKEYMLKVYPTKYPDNYFSSKYQRQYKKGLIFANYNSRQRYEKFLIYALLE